MSGYWNICKAFVEGKKIEKKWRSRVSGGMQGPLYARKGVVRLDVTYNPDGVSSLRSYEHYALAVRLPDGQIILNGDNAPTVTSRKQQGELRSVLRDVPRVIVPFSALLAAGIRLNDLEIVATTPDRETETWRKCPCKKPWHATPQDGFIEVREDGTHYVKHTDHFLGEVLFRERRFPDRFYVSGLDRNDEPRRRHFYLARLPPGASPKTVDEALEALKPEALPATGWLRQGEWFFVPGYPKPKKEEILNGFYTKRGVPVVTDNPEIMRGLLAANSRLVTNRLTRHKASRMYLNGAVYVSGMIRDAEHSPLKLGDGKTWYRVVRNTAVGSWAAGGGVD